MMNFKNFFVFSWNVRELPIRFAINTFVTFVPYCVPCSFSLWRFILLLPKPFLFLIRLAMILWRLLRPKAMLEVFGLLKVVGYLAPSPLLKSINKLFPSNSDMGRKSGCVRDYMLFLYLLLALSFGIISNIVILLSINLGCF